jgi:predicted short-subunit dehydrogenase-like oxidoreductase (DUF2520 family)
VPVHSLAPFHRIAVVGAGRVGSAIALGLARAGIAVDGPLGRGATAVGADLVILAVPDREIAAAARLIPAGTLVGHCSASTPLDVLEPHEGFLLHPLKSVPTPDAAFAGAFAAVAGSTPRALGTAEALATTLGLLPVHIAEADRALYHASASLTANALVALLWDAERMAASAGLPREALAPLAAGALDAWQARGAQAALTGPVARGDHDTVARQRDAVASRHPELVELWDAMTGRMRALAGLQEDA